MERLPIDDIYSKVRSRGVVHLLPVRADIEIEAIGTAAKEVNEDEP